MKTKKTLEELWREAERAHAEARERQARANEEKGRCACGKAQHMGGPRCYECQRDYEDMTNWGAGIIPSRFR